MKTTEAHQKIKAIVNLFRPILEAEEILEALAEAEQIKEEARAQEAQLRKSVASLKDEERKLNESINQSRALDLEKSKERKKQVEAKFGKLEADLRQKIADLELEEKSAKENARRAKEEADAYLEILNKEKGRAEADLMDIRHEIEKLKSRFA